MTRLEVFRAQLVAQELDAIHPVLNMSTPHEDTRLIEMPHRTSHIADGRVKVPYRARLMDRRIVSPFVVEQLILRTRLPGMVHAFAATAVEDPAITSG